MWLYIHLWNISKWARWQPIALTSIGLKLFILLYRFYRIYYCIVYINIVFVSCYIIIDDVHMNKENLLNVVRQIKIKNSIFEGWNSVLSWFVSLYLRDKDGLLDDGAVLQSGQFHSHSIPCSYTWIVQYKDDMLFNPLFIYLDSTI